MGADATVFLFSRKPSLVGDRNCVPVAEVVDGPGAV
jgi:hypothetical protein